METRLGEQLANTKHKGGGLTGARLSYKMRELFTVSDLAGRDHQCTWRKEFFSYRSVPAHGGGGCGPVGGWDGPRGVGGLALPVWGLRLLTHILLSLSLYIASVLEPFPGQDTVLGKPWEGPHAGRHWHQGRMVYMCARCPRGMRGLAYH